MGGWQLFQTQSSSSCILVLVLRPGPVLRLVAELAGHCLGPAGGAAPAPPPLFQGSLPTPKLGGGHWWPSSEPSVGAARPPATRPTRAHSRPCSTSPGRHKGAGSGKGSGTASCSSAYSAFPL